MFKICTVISWNATTTSKLGFVHMLNLFSFRYSVKSTKNPLERNEKPKISNKTILHTTLHIIFSNCNYYTYIWVVRRKIIKTKNQRRDNDNDIHANVYGHRHFVCLLAQKKKTVWSFFGWKMNIAWVCEREIYTFIFVLS